MKKQQLLFGGLRILIGLLFLWSFFDKLFGLGFSTTPDHAWTNGVSPTFGFLHSVAGPFAGIFHAMEGSVAVDWLFMLGLFLIGLALLIGVGMRIAAWSGTVLLFLMWLAVFPPKQNPLVDEHLIYMFVLQILSITESGRYLGFGKWWERTRFVKSCPWLQ